MQTDRRADSYARRSPVVLDAGAERTALLDASAVHAVKWVNIIVGIEST